MSILLSVFEIRKAFAARPLFDRLSFAIESGERIGLIGPNGAGKSTLLRILASQTSPDEGKVSFQKGLRVSLLEQTPRFSPNSTIESTLMEGIGGLEDWEGISRVHELISRLDLEDPKKVIADLSGGWKKRVALARELVKQPDLLLLDEPTNHLDVEGIIWLEKFIQNASFATMTITHDRVFLQRISNRILELDRRNPNGLLSVKGDYASYLEVKEQLMAAQEQSEITLKNTLRRETEWLRRGAKARTTKQQARIDRAESLKENVEDLESRNQKRKVQLEFQSAEKNPKKLIEAKGISKRFGSKIIFSDLNLLITPGKRIGILGPNGCGKSTLIRTLLGVESPDSGQVIRAEGLSVAYFEQNRETLNPDDTLSKAICPQGDHVDFRGTRVHIRSYLSRFLFSQDQMEMRIGKLSGGEQSRVLIARLMLQPAQLLVLDEPTNDLDLATLNVLEDCLKDFSGALLLVTHDRYFLDQVSNQILAFDMTPDRSLSKGSGIVSFADLDQWETWRSQLPRPEKAGEKGADKGGDKGTEKTAAPASSAGSLKKKRLGYLEQREFEGMEETIQKAEARLEELTQISQKSDVISNSTRLLEITTEMTQLQEEIDRLYSRWSELESRSKA